MDGNNLIDVKTVMNEDMFVSDFIHHIEIEVINAKSGTPTLYKFGLKELSGFDEDKLSSTAMVRTEGKITFKTEQANIAYLKASLVLAPFEITEENIKKLTVKVRNKLLEEAKRINEIPSDVVKK